MSSPPTTLPSIQFLLTQQSFEDKRFTKGHRSTRSVSSLPSELQNLSLNGPNPGIQHVSSTASKDDTPLVIKPQPSWMTGPPSVLLTPNNTSSQPPPSTTHYHQYHHQRSISDLSMPTPPVSSSSSSSTAFHSYNNNQFHQNQPGFAPTPSSLSPFQLNHQHQHQSQQQQQQQQQHHHPKQPQRQRHLSHRRAISATTVDYMMRPPTNVPPIPPLPFEYRARSNSPTEEEEIEEEEEHMPLDTTPHQPMDDFMENRRTKMTPITSPAMSSSNLSTTTTTTTTTTDAPQDLTITHATVNGMDLPRDPVTGRYLCPYCQKPFSRPSSLRIHTYSHTGEKPFVCSECPRRFNVQSNMRRHLRIHFIRPTTKTTF